MKNLHEDDFSFSMMDAIMTPEPHNSVDDSVMQDIDALNDIFKIHKNVKESGLVKDVPEFYPSNISGMYDLEHVKNLWSVGDYDRVREIYTERWMEYYTNMFGFDPIMDRDNLIRCARTWWRSYTEFS